MSFCIKRCHCCLLSGVYHEGLNQEFGLLEKTLCMSADQYFSSHYNVHSLYGFGEANSTMRWGSHDLV